MAYNNRVLTLTNQATPDPFVVNAHGKFYLTFTAGDHVEIWRANSIVGFKQNAEVFRVWQPPPNTPYTADLWAPELHALHNRWHIYVACADPAHGNPSHRMYVLGGPPADQDPCSSSTPWEFLGPIHNMPDRWAIDATVFQLPGGRGELYMAWSSWPPNDFSDRKQEIWLTRLLDPVTADGNAAICISTPDRAWEYSDGDHGVNEGPQFLASPFGNWSGIIYSCAGSWTNEYKMGILHYVPGSDPLHASSWRKDNQPLLQTRGGGSGPWGPGHGSFLELGGEIVCVYHGTDGPGDGWANRRARLQRVVFGDMGPHMGWYVGEATEDVGVFMQMPQQQGWEGQQQQQQGPPPQQQQEQGRKKHGLKGWLHDAFHGEL